MEQTIIEMICKIKADSIAPVKQEQLDLESNLLHDVCISSLQIVDLFLLIEEKYQIELEFDAFDYYTLMSIGELCDCVRKKVEEKGRND